MNEQSIAFEEVPGSRTTQQAIDQPQRERIAYEELQPGDIIQEGDEWRSECGRWQQFVLTQAKPYQVRDTLRVRRPYKITALQDERDKARAELGVALARVIAIEHNLTETKKDAARIAQEYAEWSKEAEAASSQLQHERDEARAEVQRLQEVVGNLYNEPTARQVQDMLRTWATELDWSAGCFDSAGREQIDTIQKTLIAVIERIETMINPEGGTDGE